MKRLTHLLVSSFLIVPLSLTAATITKPYTFSSGGTISSSEMNSNFDTLYTEVNTGKVGIETASRTISLNSGMTYSALQAAIDAVGKYIARDVTITFQFANGTYAYTSPIYFRGFSGQGAISIQGDTTQGLTAHTNQSVILDYAASTSNVMDVGHNSIPVTVRNFRFNLSSAGAHHGLVATANTYLHTRACYFVLAATSNNGNRGFYALSGGTAYLDGTNFNAVHNAIVAATGGTILSGSNNSSGTNPTVGLYALAGGTIVKVDATQPTAGTAETTLTGGVIR